MVSILLDYLRAGESRAEIREKGSVFLAVLGPAADEAAAKALLAGLEKEFPDATHHCWAWRLGSPPRERSADAGEPAGTAGVPILQVLRGAGLSDVMAVVVRWFGGTKLGKGGLARAYTEATRAAVADLPVVERVPVVTLAISVPYDRLGAAKRLLPRHPRNRTRRNCSNPSSKTFRPTASFIFCPTRIALMSGRKFPPARQRTRRMASPEA